MGSETFLVVIPPMATKTNKTALYHRSMIRSFTVKLTGLEPVALVGSLDLATGLGPEDTDLVRDGLGRDRVVSRNHDNLKPKQQETSREKDGTENTRGYAQKVVCHVLRAWTVTASSGNSQRAGKIAASGSQKALLVGRYSCFFS